MKKVRKASTGSLPRAEKSMKPATTVSSAASTGESQPISRDGCALASSRKRIRRLRSTCRRAWPHAAHPQADLLDAGLAHLAGRRQASLGDDRDPVADLEELV